MQDEARGAIFDRLRNPLVGSFVLTFLLVHWDTVMVAFTTDSKGEARVAETLSFFSNNSHFLVAIVLWTFYMFVMPFLNNLYDYVFVIKRKLKKEAFENLCRERGFVDYDKYSIFPFMLGRILVNNQAIRSAADTLKNTVGLSADELKKNIKTILDSASGIEQISGEIEKRVKISVRDHFRSL